MIVSNSSNKYMAAGNISCGITYSNEICMLDPRQLLKVLHVYMDQSFSFRKNNGMRHGIYSIAKLTSLNDIAIHTLTTKNSLGIITNRVEFFQLFFCRVLFVWIKQSSCDPLVSPREMLLHVESNIFMQRLRFAFADFDHGRGNLNF